MKKKGWKQKMGKEEEIYRYRTLYDIVSKENKLIKETNAELQQKIDQLSIQLEEQKNKEQPKHSIVYRGLRKIYHIVKR